MATKITRSTIDKAGAKAKPYEIRGTHGLILRVQPSGKKTFYCQFARGKRMRIGDADVITLQRAEYRAREILNEEHDFGSPLKRDLRKATLGGFIESEYSSWVKANRRRGEKTLGDLRRCFEPLYGKRLTDITRAHLDGYVSSRSDEGNAAATIVRDLNNLQGVLRLAIERGYLRESPFKNWRKPKVEDGGITRYLADSEETRLREALTRRDERAQQERQSANKWRKARGYPQLPSIPVGGYSDHLTPMVLVSLNTGLRYGELASLVWPAIDIRAKVLTVSGRTAKGAKTRHVPLNGEAFEVLTRWKKQGAGKGLVFVNANGQRIGSVKTAWFALLADARIENFRWHDLRHSFASKLVQRGVDLAIVRELLGHGDFALTLRYAHLGADQKAQAVARLAV